MYFVPEYRMMAASHKTNQEERVMKSFEVQGEQWGRNPEVWAGTFEIQMQPLLDAAFSALAPVAGLRVLDAGCGTGLAVSIAHQAGASASALDASPAFAEFVSTRTPDADVRVGDIAQLPYDDDSFDIVTAFNSIQYATSPAHAVKELARVCRAGGRVAIGVWGDPADCETEAVFDRLRSLAPPPPGTPAPLQVSAPGIVEGLLESAGLTLSGGGDAACPFIFSDVDHAWKAHSSAGPIQKVIGMVGAEKVRATIASVLEADRKSDTELRQDNVFRYVIATKPAL
jgi:ubiquinone/menaquinone biosynthesis C-methylase UbiE